MNKTFAEVNERLDSSKNLMDNHNNYIQSENNEDQKDNNSLQQTLNFEATQNHHSEPRILHPKEFGQTMDIATWKANQDKDRMDVDIDSAGRPKSQSSFKYQNTREMRSQPIEEI